MYLSRLILNLRSRAVQQDLADCHSLHQRLMSGFPQAPDPGDGRAHFGVLYRLDVDLHAGRALVLVQSQVEPDWSSLPVQYLAETGGDHKNPACKRVDQAYQHLKAGSVLAFRLRANPSRKIDTKSGPDGHRRNGKRVELRSEDARLDWLRRKAQQGGFSVLSVRANPGVPNVRANPGDKLSGWRSDRVSGENRKLNFASVLFEGVLQVSDAELFCNTLSSGIGPGKAFGFGLLSVAPAEGGTP